MMKEHLPHLPKRYRIKSIVPISKDVLPPIRVSRLMPEGHGKCAHCGAEASHVITYTQDGDSHQVVYQNIFSWHRMFTADHFLPRSLGGRDGLSNLQLMCERCNQHKGNNLSYDELIEIKKNRHLYVRPHLTPGQIKNILNLQPALTQVFDGYNSLKLETDFSVSEVVATEPFMHLITDYKPKRIKAKSGHGYQPMKRWEQLLLQFPELERHVQFGLPF